MSVPGLRTIRGRLVTACVLLVFAPLGATWGLGWYDALDVRAEAEALSRVAEEIREAPARLGAVATREHVYARRLDAHGEIVEITDPGLADGRAVSGVLAQFADFFFGPAGAPSIDEVEEEAGELFVRPEVLAARRGATGATIRLAPSGGLAVAYHAVPLDDGVLVLARARRRSARSLYDSRYQLLKLTLALCLAAVVVGGWLAWTVVAPIAALRRRIDGGDPLGLPRDDEIGALAADFEALRGRLAQQLAHTTRATADLAHELKSPVAAVAAAAELVESSEPMTEARRRRIATAMSTAATQMSATLDAVLALAALDESLYAEPRESVALSALARRVADCVPAGALTVEVSVSPSDLVVDAVPGRLEEAVRTLLDNAVAFARQRVLVEIRAEDHAVVIAVQDDGPGVPPGERALVFQRFYSTRAAGTGLGLPIACTIAQAHGGTVTLADAGGGGTRSGARFELRLPTG